MAALTVQKLSLTGLNVATASAGAGGDTFTNDGKTVLEVTNGSGGSINVTVDSTRPCSYGADHNVVVAVPAAGSRRIGPFPVARFGDPVSVAYSDVTTVTVAAVSTG
jgi:hypothetical protein